MPYYTVKATVTSGSKQGDSFKYEVFGKESIEAIAVARREAQLTFGTHHVKVEVIERVRKRGD